MFMRFTVNACYHWSTYQDAFSLKLCACQNTRRIPWLQPKSGNVFLGFKDRALRLRLSLDHSRLLWPLRHVPCLWCGALCWGPHGSNEGYLERKPLRESVGSMNEPWGETPHCVVFHVYCTSIHNPWHLVFFYVFATDDFSEPKPEPYIWHLTKVCCSHKVSCLKSELGRNSLCSKTQKKRMFSNDFSPLVGCRWNAQHVHFTLCKLWNCNGS